MLESFTRHRYAKDVTEDGTGGGEKHGPEAGVMVKLKFPEKTCNSPSGTALSIPKLELES